MRARPANRSWWRHVLALLACAVAAHAAPDVLRGGWYAQPPLEFRPGEAGEITGLDVELIRAIAHEAGWRVQFEESQWDQQLEQLQHGEHDIAFGAIATPESAAYARFSDPYHRTENSLYARAAELERLRCADVASFLALVRQQHLRLGVVKGRAPLLPEVQAFVADPANAPFIVASHTDTQNLTALALGEIDVALADRLVAATLLTQLGYDQLLAAHPLSFGAADVRVMFSRATTTEADVANFNRALQAVRDRKGIEHVLHRYLLPPLLDIAISGRWFYWLDLIGTAAFALSGVILAHQGRYNLIGAFLLSALPAVGGGVLRDLVVNRHPVGVLRSPTALVIVVALVFAGYVLFRLLDRAPNEERRQTGRFASAFTVLCGIFDTIGLAAFTVTGVRVAAEQHCDPLWLWGPLLAVLTGAGGGVLRDIVRSDFHNPTLKRGFYAEVALVWGLALSVFLEWEVRRIGVDEVRHGTLLVLFGAFLTRILILHRGWDNPLVFGNRHTLPQRRLAALVARVRALVTDWPEWFEEPAGLTQPRTRVEIEKRHNHARREFASARAALDELALEPLPPDVAHHVATFRRELELLAAAEEALYGLVLEPAFAAEPAQRVQQAVFASAAALGAVAADSMSSTEPRAMLLALTREHTETLDTLRTRLAESSDAISADERARMLQFTVRFERLAQLLHDAGRTVSTPP